MKSPRTDGDAQLGLGLRVPSRPLKLSRDLRSIPVDRYRLSSDGRKWKAIARERMALAEWLGTYADGDGSRIWTGVKAMRVHFRWSRAKTFRLLADLKKLQLLEDEKNADGKSCLNGERGTRKRRMNLPAFLAGATPSSSPGLGPIEIGREGELESQIRGREGELGSQIRELESQVTIDTTGTLTDPGPVAGFEVESLTGVGRAKSSSSGKTVGDLALDPDWDSIDRKNERLIEEATTILIREGWEATVVTVGLQRIRERSDFSGTVPAAPGYYVSSFKTAMADEREKSEILKRAKRRKEVMGSQSEIRQTADEIKRVSESSGRPPKSIVAERARARAVAGSE